MQEMEDGWPSGVALRGEAPNHPVLRWLKTVVVNDRGEGALDASGGDQEDVPEAFIRAEPGGASSMKHRKSNRRHRNRGLGWPWEEAWRVPAYWPGGARCVDDVSLVCCSCTEREKAGRDSVHLDHWSWWARGSVPTAATGGTEYRCAARWRTDPQ